jgi:hypothetical protein
MNPVDRQAALKRLEWVEKARLGIVAAIGDVVDPTFKVFPTVDPLKFILKISLNRPLSKATRDPLRTYVRLWAQEFGCDVPIINIGRDRVQAQVLTRQKVWDRNARGRFKPKERFVRRNG